MSASKGVIGAGIIAAISAVIVALIQFHPWSSSAGHETPAAVAGRVVNSHSNETIGQVDLTIGGRTESYISEDNGNFRIELTTKELEGERRLRLRASKQGYRPWDRTVSVPLENLIIQMDAAP
jgi:hypothetical protein